MTYVRYDLALTSLTEGAGPALSTFASVLTSSGSLPTNLAGLPTNLLALLPNPSDLPTNLLGEIEADLWKIEDKITRLQNEVSR